MKIVIIKKNKERLNKFLDWILYMIGYTLVFILASLIFKNFYVDTSNYYIYSFLAVLIIYLLNKTIKPLIVSLTIPITGLTLGLFYPLINLFILKLTDWIMASHFNLGNTPIIIVIAIFISIMNVFMEEIIIKPIIRRFKENG